MSENNILEQPKAPLAVGFGDGLGVIVNQKWFYIEYHKNGKFTGCDEFLAADASQAESKKRLDVVMWIDGGGTVEFGLLTERYKRK